MSMPRTMTLTLVVDGTSLSTADSTLQRLNRPQTIAPEGWSTSAFSVQVSRRPGKRQAVCVKPSTSVTFKILKRCKLHHTETNPAIASNERSGPWEVGKRPVKAHRARRRLGRVGGGFLDPRADRGELWRRSVTGAPRILLCSLVRLVARSTKNTVAGNDLDRLRGRRLGSAVRPLQHHQRAGTARRRGSARRQFGAAGAGAPTRPHTGTRLARPQVHVGRLGATHRRRATPASGATRAHRLSRHPGLVPLR